MKTYLGGKLIGKGTSGCVYKPSLKCIGSERIEDGYLSKLMNNYDAHDEIRQQKIIDEIDPNYHFHLEMGVVCKPEIPDSENDDLLTDCEIGDVDMNDVITSPDFQSDYSIVHFKDGGASLSSYYDDGAEDMKNIKHCEMMLYDFTRMIFGLKEFSKHDIGHFDIKGDNIVYDKKSNRFNYIDFGNAGTYGNFIDIFLENYLGYYIVPYELYLALIDDPSIDMILETIIGMGMGSTRIDVNPIVGVLSSLYAPEDGPNYRIRNAKQLADISEDNYGPYGLNSEHILSEKVIYDYIKYSKKLFMSGDLPDEIKERIRDEILKKFDTFSLSLVMIEFLSQMVSLNAPTFRKPVVSYSYNNEAAIEDYATYLGSISETFESFYRLILKMNVPSFAGRVSPEDAYALYVKEIYTPIKSKYGLESLSFVDAASSPRSSISTNTGGIRKPKRVINPKTGRLIKKDGPTYRKLKGVIKRKSHKGTKLTLKRTSKKHTSKSKKCSPLQVVNPLTKRCIIKDGQTYKTLKKRGILS